MIEGLFVLLILAELSLLASPDVVEDPLLFLVLDAVDEALGIVCYYLVMIHPTMLERRLQS